MSGDEPCNEKYIWQEWRNAEGRLLKEEYVGCVVRGKHDAHHSAYGQSWKRKPARPSFDEYYLGVAAAVSARGECSRRKVGAVIVSNKTIVSTGYNGAASGEKSCLDGACPRAESDATPGTGYASSGCTVIHAEANAIIRAGRERCLGATIYITDAPCELCRPLIHAAGIARIVSGSPEDLRVLEQISRIGQELQG
jgi:dCMP deaminase